ncbi:hypothetical protein NDU88_004968, partial [Pleurodeles waltl]
RIKKQYSDDSNVLLERFNFAMCKQSAHESADEYLANLCVRTSKCDFGNIVDMYIRDRFVFHCYSKKVQE